MIAVQNHLALRNIGHRAETGNIVFVALPRLGLGLDAHADLKAFGKFLKGLDQQQILVVIAVGILGLQAQVDTVVRCLPLQGGLDHRKNIPVSAMQVLDGLLRMFDQVAPDIRKLDIKGYHAVLGDMHGKCFRFDSFSEIQWLVSPASMNQENNFCQTIIPTMKMQLLGGMTAAHFLRHYWQKRPLLIRGAIPGFRDPLPPGEIRRLARLQEVESRLVWRRGKDWHLERGPVPAARFSRMPAKDWTVLVQGLNLHSNAADMLLRRFNFIPWARLDDLMASYAAPGGGVGPHVDSYDVFLLQGKGRRRWRISGQTDHSLAEGAPLAVLSNFRPEEEWILKTGDMLYLPPHIAHEGVALDACITWSIGFRAPSARELGAALLDRLDQALHSGSIPPRYGDRDPKAGSDTGRIPQNMLGYAKKVAAQLVLTNNRIESALGQALSEPKASVSFDPPDPVQARGTFGKSLRLHGLRLDRRTQLLYLGGNFYVNGEVQPATGLDAALLRGLSDRRQIPPRASVARATHDLLYRWYVYGWLHTGILN